jgi:hypothetical protein
MPAKGSPPPEMPSPSEASTEASLSLSALSADALSPPEMPALSPPAPNMPSPSEGETSEDLSPLSPIEPLGEASDDLGTMALSPQPTGPGPEAWPSAVAALNWLEEAREVDEVDTPELEAELDRLSSRLVEAERLLAEKRALDRQLEFEGQRPVALQLFPPTSPHASPVGTPPLAITASPLAGYQRWAAGSPLAGPGQRAPVGTPPGRPPRMGTADQELDGLAGQALAHTPHARTHADLSRELGALLAGAVAPVAGIEAEPTREVPPGDSELAGIEAELTALDEELSGVADVLDEDVDVDAELARLDQARPAPHTGWHQLSPHEPLNPPPES